VSCKILGQFFGLNGKLLEQQYLNHLSDFPTWSHLETAEDNVIIPENIGEYLSIDETSLSQGELYTILTNKEAKGGKGSLVAIIKGTDGNRIKDLLMRKIPHSQRRLVKEITLDMAPSMQLIASQVFKKAALVTDRFHVQQLAFDAVQQIRIKHRWDAINQENDELDLAKQLKRKWIPNRLKNGDTPKQLLARSRYLLFKRKDHWTPSQIHRAEILFENYPDIKRAYDLTQKLGAIYSQTNRKDVAYTKLAQWYNDVEQEKFKSFNTISRTIQNNYETILNYFDKRSTNASAESFNAKIKALRAQFRGVRNVPFFLYRLCKIYG